MCYVLYYLLFIVLCTDCMLFFFIIGKQVFQFNQMRKIQMNGTKIEKLIFLAVIVYPFLCYILYYVLDSILY